MLITLFSSEPAKVVKHILHVYKVGNKTGTQSFINDSALFTLPAAAFRGR